LKPAYAEDIDIYLFSRLVGVDTVEGAHITMGDRTWIVMGIVDFGTKVRIGLLEPDRLPFSSPRATDEQLREDLAVVLAQHPTSGSPEALGQGRIAVRIIDELITRKVRRPEISERA
jgi:hypothetical protein